MGNNLVLEERISDLINFVSCPLCLLCDFLQTCWSGFVDASDLVEAHRKAVTLNWLTLIELGDLYKLQLEYFNFLKKNPSLLMVMLHFREWRAVFLLSSDSDKVVSALSPQTCQSVNGISVLNPISKGISEWFLFFLPSGWVFLCIWKPNSYFPILVL